MRNFITGFLCGAATHLLATAYLGRLMSLFICVAVVAIYFGQKIARNKWLSSKTD